MTPDSILRAVAEAMAKKYTSPELLDHPMARMAQRDPGQLPQVEFATPREAAVEAMTVVGPVLELVWELRELLKRSRAALDDMAQDVEGGPSAEYHALSWELGEFIAKVNAQEPADWGYVSRFSATPNEIHDILRSGLHPKVHLAYQQAIGKQVAAEVAKGLRDLAEESMPLAERINDPVNAALYEMVLRCADRVDRMPVPKEVVELSRGTEEPR